jgi:hypothetical protein
MFLLRYQITENGIDYLLFFSDEMKANIYIEKHLKTLYPNLKTKLFLVAPEMIDPNPTTSTDHSLIFF